MSEVKESEPNAEAEAPPVEIDVPVRDPESIAIEIMREARTRLSTGPTPCAADSERLLARTAWIVFEHGNWPAETATPVRAALERLLPIR
ncbi:MAG: hypothetical protein ACO3YY_02345 [Phycisphaerales bacterium]|jgi:hypothetical protein